MRLSIVGSNVWSKKNIPNSHVATGQLYRSNRSWYARIPNPKKNVTPPAPSGLCFPSNDQRQHTLHKKNKICQRQVAENGSSAMTLAFLRISCQTPELLSKAPHGFFNDGSTGPMEVMKEATMLNGRQGMKGIFRYNKKNEYRRGVAVPSLKLTVRTWNTGVGRWVSFCKGHLPGAMLVSGRATCWLCRNYWPLPPSVIRHHLQWPFISF